MNKYSLTELPMRPNKSKVPLENAALELFVQKGVAETSVRDIAAKANIAEGTLYRHYPSKEAFARHLYQNAAAKISSDISAINADSGDLESCVSTLVIYFCTLFDEEKTTFSYVLLTPAPTLKLLEVGNVHPARQLADIMGERLKKRNQTDRLPALIAAEVLGAITGVAHQVQLGVLRDSMGAYADDLMLAVFRILKP
ncbi:MAG: TetR/AcrR family transcriptional regulator [Holosporales bacterium]|jgi:AcrR family transcriptional regulator